MTVTYKYWKSVRSISMWRLKFLLWRTDRWRVGTWCGAARWCASTVVTPRPRCLSTGLSTSWIVSRVARGSTCRAAGVLSDRCKWLKRPVRWDLLTNRRVRRLRVPRALVVRVTFFVRTTLRRFPGRTSRTDLKRPPVFLVPWPTYATTTG